MLYVHVLAMLLARFKFSIRCLNVLYWTNTKFTQLCGTCGCAPPPTSTWVTPTSCDQCSQALLTTLPLLSTQTRLKVASFPGHLPLCSLDHIHDPWTARRSWYNFYVIKRKVDSIMTCGDLVLVIMATCLHTLLQEVHKLMAVVS